MDEKKTCATCANIGAIYWDVEFSDPKHHCLKGVDRRKAQFQSCGDFSQDFMNEFRKFFDASADQPACSLYQARQPIEPDKLAILQEVQEAGGRKLFKFFSPENRIAQDMRGKFLQEDTARHEMDGFRAYRITKVGIAELALARTPQVNEAPHD
jgi:hypothetical protein